MNNYHSEAGKGDRQRKSTISDEQIKKNWNDIFKSNKVDNAPEEARAMCEESPKDSG